MNTRVYIIHGWEATPESNWFPWLKKELENQGFEVYVPQMPDTHNPDLSKWLHYLQKLARNPNENTYFVGHSLGVITILRFLESLPTDVKIGGAILVAGFPEPIGYEELNSFFITPLDYEKVKNSAKKFIAIHSDNDPCVPLKNGEILKNKFGAELIILPNSGHLNAGDGYFRLPIALEKIMEITK
jgi:predicted alpha/beta hydrolase family esterase